MTGWTYTWRGLRRSPAPRRRRRNPFWAGYRLLNTVRAVTRGPDALARLEIHRAMWRQLRRTFR
jgi:hypothetical protein